MRSPIVLIWLLVLTTQRTLGSDVVHFVNKVLYDGDPCMLEDGSAGQCRKEIECGRKHSSRAVQCGFEGNHRIVCCDVVQKQCDSIGQDKPLRISDHLIGNTETADAGEFPFMALIVFDTSQFRCGASLISSQFVLTAAHCIKNKDDAKPVAVKLGITEITDPMPTEIAVDQTFVHERYSSSYKVNDIAVIKLNRSVEFNSLIQPICLQSDENDIAQRKQMTILGWGVMNEDLEASQQLLKANVLPMSLENCKTRFAQVHSRIRLSDNHICALGSENADRIATDACQGDSGGPLVLKKNGRNCLVGVISTGGNCGNSYLAGVYVNVNKYRSWIIEKGVWSAV